MKWRLIVGIVHFLTILCFVCKHVRHFCHSKDYNIVKIFT